MRYATILLFLLLTTCSSSPSQELDLSRETNPSKTSTPTKTPSPIPPASPSPQKSIEPSSICQDNYGTVESLVLDDPQLSRELEFKVFLPPCYHENEDKLFPALYLLHGLAQDHEQWITLGTPDIASELINAGIIEPLIIIMPRERTGLEMETAVIDVLIPHMDTNYRICDLTTCNAIGGLSRGAGIALQIAIKNPRRFGTVGLHSPAILASESWLAYWIQEIPRNRRPRLLIDIGEKDTLRLRTEEFLRLLDQLGVPYRWYLGEGEHTNSYWESQIVSYLRRYDQGWGSVASEGFPNHAEPKSGMQP